MIDVKDPNKLRQLMPGERWHKASRAFIEGDHYQGGDGWIGPVPPEGTEGRSDIMREIESGFTSQNVIAEIDERHTVGVVGREPAFGWTPRANLPKGEPIPDDLAEAIDFLNAETTIWWNEKRVHDVVRDVVADVLWAARSCARIFIPLGRLRKRTYADGRAELIVRAGDLREALAQIYVEHPMPENSTVYEDPDTREKVGIFIYRTTDDFPREIVEAVWTDGKNTFVRIFDDQAPTAKPSEDGAPAMTATLNLGGRLTMFEIRRNLLITPQIIQQQKALNLSISMLPRNVITGGFLERIILNAQLPGEWVEQGEGKPKKFVPEAFHVGAGTTNVLQGTQYTEQGTDGQTRVHLANPNVVFREPVDTAPTIATIEAHYKMMLNEADQSHILIQSDAIASGKSREQARGDFVASMSLTNTRVEEMGRWLMETVVAFAEQLIGSPGLYTSRLRAVFKCRLDAGPLNADEQRQKMEAGDAGYLSKEAVQIAMGVDDTDAENALINSQPGANLRIVKDQAAALTPLLATGMAPDLALALVGIEDEDGKIADSIKAKQEADRQAAKDQLAAKTNGLAPNRNNGPKGAPAPRGATRKPAAPGKKLGNRSRP